MNGQPLFDHPYVCKPNKDCLMWLLSFDNHYVSAPSDSTVNNICQPAYILKSTCLFAFAGVTSGLFLCRFLGRSFLGPGLFLPCTVGTVVEGMLWSSSGKSFLGACWNRPTTFVALGDAFFFLFHFSVTKIGLFGVPLALKVMNFINYGNESRNNNINIDGNVTFTHNGIGIKLKEKKKWDGVTRIEKWKQSTVQKVQERKANTENWEIEITRPYLPHVHLQSGPRDLKHDEYVISVLVSASKIGKTTPVT